MARKFIWIFRIILQKNLEELFVQLKTDINLTKCAQDHYGENYNILGEITKANKWRDVTHSWTERLDSIKMSVLPNLILTNPTKKIFWQLLLWLLTNLL